MTSTVLRVALTGALVMAGTARADEPLLPSPRPLAVRVVGPVSFVRPNPYAVWQNYAVDRRGYWRPLVVPSYDGPRYAATGEPFPWWKEHARSFDPVIANAATFGGPRVRPIFLPTPPPPVTPTTGWERMPYAED